MHIPCVLSSLHCTCGHTGSLYCIWFFEKWIHLYSIICSCRNYCCLWTLLACWLLVPSLEDLKNECCWGVSRIFKHTFCFIHVVTLYTLIGLKFTTSAAEVSSAQTQFCGISSNSVISGCIDAITGLQVVIQCPSMKDCSKSLSLYDSGHYCCHGLNVQAVCDTFCQLTFGAVLLPITPLIRLP